MSVGIDRQVGKKIEYNRHIKPQPAAYFFLITWLDLVFLRDVYILTFHFTIFWSFELVL